MSGSVSFPLAAQTDVALPGPAPRPAANQTQLRETLLDIFALNSYSWLLSIPIELWLAGMSLQEHLQVRMLAVLINTLIARPFTLYREQFLLHYRRLLLGSASMNGLQAYLADTLVFISFQLPLYIANMWLGGADVPEIVAASGTFLLIAGAIGRPYGAYLDWLRRAFGWAR